MTNKKPRTDWTKLVDKAVDILKERGLKYAHATAYQEVTDTRSYNGPRGWMSSAQLIAAAFPEEGLQFRANLAPTLTQKLKVAVDTGLLQRRDSYGNMPAEFLYVGPGTEAAAERGVKEAEQRVKDIKKAARVLGVRVERCSSDTLAKVPAGRKVARRGRYKPSDRESACVMMHEDDLLAVMALVVEKS